jgi:Mn2+/Fe2+ NRAMP family transporter
VTVALIVTQEMCARMGAITGKGLADLIRENFGVKVTAWVLLLFVACDLGNTASEFAGVAATAPIFAGFVHVTDAGLLKVAMVAGAALLVFVTVTRGNYRIVERIFFVFCFVYIAYVISGIVVHPNWHEVIRQTLFPHFLRSNAYLLMIVAVIGTTISPWMQFYIQAAVVEKGIHAPQYAASRVDVISGAVVTDIVAYFIIVACAATIYVHNFHVPAAHQIAVNGVGDVAVALQPIAGRFASVLFAVGLLNAALFTASILPLSTAYYVCEAFGFERGIDHHFRDARTFYGLYAALIFIGGGAVIVPGAPLLAIIFYSQVLNGALLPVVLVLMLLLVNNKRLMGTWTNTPFLNGVAWTTVAVVSALTAVSTVQAIFSSG